MARQLTKKPAKVQKVIKKVVAQPARKAGGGATAQTTFTIPNAQYFEGIGRRKVATARVRIYAKEGDFVVNNKVVGDYFGGIINSPTLYNLPFEVTGTKGKYAVTVKVSGSGVKAQMAAVVHGLARALVKMNADFQPLLKQASLLSRDDRMKETRKIGTGGKARRKRQSPKR
jgi:small subunit ribosomal protein S9